MRVVLFLLLLCPLLLRAQTALIPAPKEYERQGEERYPIVAVEVREGDFANPEEYRIEARQGTVEITGNEVWARQTLEQLKDEQGRVPDVVIRDWPDYPFRGFMHDTGRNYQPLEMLKQTIDLMCFYKLNVFHWHLTDHPAWRIECKAYPQLNDPQFQRPGRDPGAFYTYGEIRELIAYAQERGIRVMPEIDMPGHSTYFKDAFGFAMDSEEGRRVLEQCLTEFFTEIPQSLCPILHVGSDEVHIADPQGFMQWVEDLMERHGRQIVVWDPGLPASDRAIRQIWNTASGSNAAAAVKGGRYLDSFMGYLNYYDPIAFTNQVFLHTPAAQQEPDTSRALGGVLCLWNDVRVDHKENIALHNGMVNGIMPFAERFWNGGTLDEPEQALVAFEKTMLLHRERYHGNAMRWAPNASMRWEVTIGAQPPVPAIGGAVDLDALCAEHGMLVPVGAEAVARTVLLSDCDTVVPVWIGFDTPARSNRNGVGIGPQGAWEGEGRVTVNGTEVKPPLPWKEPGCYEYHYHTWGKPEEEEPYTDEQLYWMREPAMVSLKKGKNLVEVRTPRVYEGLRWSFAFIPLR